MTYRGENDEEIIQGELLVAFLLGLGVYAQAGGDDLERYGKAVADVERGDSGTLIGAHDGPMFILYTIFSCRGE